MSRQSQSNQTIAGIISSPPVVQNPRAKSFGVSIAVSSLATAWVEYGFAEDDLAFTAVVSNRGLIVADDSVLHIRVNHHEALPTDKPIYYRVGVQSVSYESAYLLHRGELEFTPVYALCLPSPNAESIRVISINDTHVNIETLSALHTQIEKVQPDLLIWNGDTCHFFDANNRPEQILLNPLNDVNRAWASTRPLLFSNGNHDVRGSHAHEVTKSFAGCPESVDLPYSQALRLGPLALITLDTGEDKPDRREEFAGTAAYEPYREMQSDWLGEVLRQAEIEGAPFMVATSHIPLRGLDGQNNGLADVDFARYSGFCAKIWLPKLQAAGCNAILSGHTHHARHDTPTEEMSVHQFVGGGPEPEEATLTIIDASLTDGNALMDIIITNLQGDVCFKHSFA